DPLRARRRGATAARFAGRETFLIAAPAAPLPVHFFSMPLPKILLFGKVGRELRRTLAPMSSLVCVDYPEVDFTAPDSIRRHIADAAPDIIVNAAAYTAVDKAETETALATKINADAPGIMAGEAKKRDALLVHYSTDYVFDGTKTTPYVETDTP